jgi:hypothetical protein
MQEKSVMMVMLGGATDAAVFAELKQINTGTVISLDPHACPTVAGKW